MSSYQPTGLRRARFNDEVDDQFLGGSIYLRELFAEAHTDRRYLLEALDASLAKLRYLMASPEGTVPLTEVIRIREWMDSL